MLGRREQCVVCGADESGAESAVAAAVAAESADQSDVTAAAADYRYSVAERAGWWADDRHECAGVELWNVG